MESRHSQLAKSLSNLYQIVEIYNSTCRSRSRSLPNIVIPPPNLGGGGENQSQYSHQYPYSYPSDFSGGGPVKKHHNKILKKTWDKVKTAIIHTTSSHSARRASLNKTKLDSGSKQGMNLPQFSTAAAASSAPSTPLHKQSFDFDTQPQTSPQPQSGRRLEGNFLSSSSNKPQHDFLRSVSANAGDMRSQPDHVTVDDWTESRETTEDEKISPTEAQKNVEEESQKIQQNYARLQKRLSEELHQRMSEHKPVDSKTVENLSEDFKKRLREWEMWRVSTGKVTFTDEEIAKILPLEFSQKLHEWETIKTSGIHHGHSKTPDSLASGTTSHARDTSSPEVLPSTKNKLLRKKKSSSESSRQKELAWLEKQLEKIEVEKKRLEREMKKYVEREARLQKMKEALQNASPSEVWIRTPTGKCKVEKITQKFARKLYQWEEMHGIQPESSTMALLHPKYYGPPPADNDEDAEIERRAQAEFNSRRYKDDTPPAVSSSRGESESRQDECDCEEDVQRCPSDGEEDQGTEHEDNELYDHDQDQQEEKDEPQKPGHDEQEGHRDSSASSSDFEEATDSFATHDKGNSGASNTDSDFNYRAEFPTRRRSSEAISTPLSARSPSLSAFTSDDEPETCGLLKTVSEENENAGNLKDAESQTEIVLNVRAKPILVEDDEDNEAGSVDESQQQTGIFVPTKRTIFELEPFEGGDLLKSPSLIRKAVFETQPEITNNVRVLTPPPPSKPLTPTPTDILPCFSSSSNSFSITPRTSPIPPSSTPVLPRPPPPRIVEVTPKIHPTSQPRGFPKMGKIPVWCSPLGTRRHLGAGSTSGSIQSEKGGLLSQNSVSSLDFCTESSYFSHPPSSVPCSSTSLCQPPSKIGGGRRNTSANTATVPEESGIVGASITTGQRHPAFPVRSSSFRIQRHKDHPHDEGEERSPNKGFYAQLRSRVGSVAKSQSTGSIRSKLGKALATFTHKISPKEGQNNEDRAQQGVTGGDKH